MRSLDKKKLMSIFTAFIMLICLAGCGSVSNKPAEPAEAGENAEAGETVVAEETAEPEEENKVSEAASGENMTEVSEETSAAEEGDMEDLRLAVNEFAGNLYNAYEGEGNLFFSPFSIESAVALTGLAAKGDTREGIEKALSIKDYDRFKTGMKKFDSREQSDSAYLKNANGLFISDSLKLSEDHEKEFDIPAKEYFDGEFRQVDFQKTESVKEDIASWVKEKTGDMIPDYEPIVSADTVADILNAVYFYGEWQKSFAHGDTWEQDFHGVREDRTVEMMHMEDRSFRYLSDEGGVKAVALPYKDSDFEMDIFMYADSESRDVSGIFRENSVDGLLNKLDSAEETELSELALPKFRMDLNLEGLKEKLISFGMERAFSDGADFSGLAGDIKISDIAHRAVIEVDEEGSRAAAVTEVMMELTSVPPEEEKKEEFIADRPFVFIIKDRESGVILFMGRFSGEN